MKDFVGNTLKVGDKVAFINTTFQSLFRGTIIRFTQKLVHIIYWRDYREYTTKRLPSSIVKIIKEN